MLDEFVLRALLAGGGVALAAGPLGAFVVWRRMAYFGEALAQSALLGVVIGLLLELDPLLAMLGFTLLLAGALSMMEQWRVLPADALLGILAHGALAFGLILVSLMDWIRIDLMGLLFGDILSVTDRDLLLVAALLAAVALILRLIWQPLLSLTVQPDLAAVEGVRVAAVRLVFNLVLAGTIAIGMKIVGIVLVVSLLVVPAATARLWARTPLQMALLAAVLGVAATLGGIGASLVWDLPTGPAIVATASAIFALASLMRALAGGSTAALTGR